MRVSLARALTLEPELFLFDEPFAALDEITRERLGVELTELFAARPFAGLFITHSVSEAVFLSSRVLVMSGRPGTIVESSRFRSPSPSARTAIRGRIQRTRRPGVGGIARGTLMTTHTDQAAAPKDPVEPDPGAPSTTTDIAVLAQKVKPAAGAVKKMAGPFAVFLLVLGAWYLVSYGVLDPDRRFLMPPPREVITDGLLGDQADEMWQGLARTAGVALTGLIVATVIGMTWAVAMAQSKQLENALFPYAVVLQCIPVLALVPLVGFWFGFGFGARVFVCADRVVPDRVEHAVRPQVGRSTPAGPVRSAQTGPLDDAAQVVLSRGDARDLRRAENLGRPGGGRCDRR